MVNESGGGRPKWVSCLSGWLRRWTYVVCLYRLLTLVVDGVAATEVGSERVRYVVGRGVRCFEDESEGFLGTARGASVDLSAGSQGLAVKDYVPQGSRGEVSRSGTQGQGQKTLAAGAQDG